MKSKPLCSCCHLHPNRGTTQETPQISLRQVYSTNGFCARKPALADAKAVLLWNGGAPRRPREELLFLVGTFRYSGGALAVRFGLWLDQYNLTGFNVAQLFTRFFLDGAGIFPLQAIDLVLELLVYHLFLVDLLLKADSFGSLAFVDLHAIGAEDHLVTYEHGKDSDA